MRSLIFNRPGAPLELVDLPDPEPDEGEVVIRVSRCGVCGTDLHATSGHGMALPAGSQLGHEYAGEVVAIGKGVEGLRQGDRIAALPVIGCGDCDGCRTGLDVLCKNFTGYGEGLAEYARVGARGAIRLPATVSLEDGALVEPLSVGLRGVRLADPKPGDRVLIIGPGPIGLAVLFWLRTRGIENVAMLASSERRKGLSATMGASGFAVESDDAAGEIAEILGGAPDIVFEAAGVPGVLSRAIELVRPQGRIVALGFCLQPDPIVPGAALMKDVNIRFSIIYTREDYAGCIRMLETHADLARALVTQTVGLAEAPAAFEDFRHGRIGGGKLLIDPGA